MASDQQKSSHSVRYNVILLGKTGSGKSAAGNTILREKAFISRKSCKSVTQEVQMKSVTFDGVILHVYDTPGLFNSEIRNELTISKWQPLLHLDESAHTVFLVVMKTDRLALEEKEAVGLIEGFIPERLIQNTWILFTRGDELEREDLTVEEFIEDTEGVKDLVQRFQNRYHVFNNFNEGPEQVRELINKIRKASKLIAPEMGFPRTVPPSPEKDPLDRRMVLLGKTGVGKSATGNTILGEEKFRSEFSSSSITSETEIHHGVVSGRKVSVIDTPGLFDTKLSLEKLSVEIGRSIYLSSPGPHAFLYIQPLNVRFTEQEENVVQKLEEIFGKETKKYTMILFTHGDQLKGKSVDALIKENESLQKLVDECGGGYHVFNNTLRNRQQVSELLQKINKMVEENGGTCYSNEMFEEAARLRQVRRRATSTRENCLAANSVEETNTHNDPEDKGLNFFLKKYWILIFVGIVGGAVIGTVVGTVVGVGVGVGVGGGVGGYFHSKLC